VTAAAAAGRRAAAGAATASPLLDRLAEALAAEEPAAATEVQQLREWASRAHAAARVRGATADSADAGARAPPRARAAAKT
jgi:hypothetical protein